MKATQILNVSVNALSFVSVRALVAKLNRRLVGGMAVLAAMLGMTVSSASGVMIDLSNGTPAGFSGMTTYTAPNGTVVTSSYGTWSNNSAHHYYMHYLFNGSLGNTQTDVWLTSNGGATTGNTLTIALNQPYFLDYVRVRADALTGWRSNYLLEVSQDNVNWTNITGGYVNTQSDAVGTGHNHTIFAEAQYLRFDLTKLSGLNGVSLNEIQIFALTDGTVATTPLSNSSILFEKGGVGELVTMTDAVELTNVGGPDTVVTIDGFTITGANPSQFSVTNFSTTALADGQSALFDISYLSSLAGGESALLTFMTNVGDFTFELEAAAVPEPSSAALLFGALGIALCARRRRK